MMIHANKTAPNQGENASDAICGHISTHELAVDMVDGLMLERQPVPVTIDTGFVCVEHSTDRNAIDVATSRRNR